MLWSWVGNTRKTQGTKTLLYQKVNFEIPKDEAKMAKGKPKMLEGNLEVYKVNLKYNFN